MALHELEQRFLSTARLLSNLADSTFKPALAEIHEACDERKSPVTMEPFTVIDVLNSVTEERKRAVAAIKELGARVRHIQDFDNALKESFEEFFVLCPYCKGTKGTKKFPEFQVCEECGGKGFHIKALKI